MLRKSENDFKEAKDFLQAEFAKWEDRGKISYKIAIQVREIEADFKGTEYEAEITSLCERLTVYKPFQESDIYGLIQFITWSDDKYNNFYFDCLNLVNMVNAYWDITGEKPANRIAWGWEKCREKDNPKAYLYGCIRNYLKRNGKFDKQEFNKIWFGRL